MTKAEETIIGLLTQMNEQLEVIADNTKRKRAKTERKPADKPPTIEEVVEYGKSRGYANMAQSFFDYYDATQWHDVGGKPVKSWKGKFVAWEKNNKSDAVMHGVPSLTPAQNGYQPDMFNGGNQVPSKY